MPVSERTYRTVALEDPEGHWELFDGRLREKPAMSFGHNDVMHELFYALRSQLPRNAFRVRSDSARVNRSDVTYFIPDIFVVPIELTTVVRGAPNSLETYTAPLPLVVEVWSPSTGGYDVDRKFPEYMRRGDLEIWRIHPYERTLTRWQRQADGSYTESSVNGGIVEPVALPGVRIDLDALFEF